MLFLPGCCIQVWGTQYADISVMYTDLDLREMEHLPLPFSLNGTQEPKHFYYSYPHSATICSTSLTKQGNHEDNLLSLDKGEGLLWEQCLDNIEMVCLRHYLSFWHGAMKRKMKSYTPNDHHDRLTTVTRFSPRKSFLVLQRAMNRKKNCEHVHAMYFN